MKTEEKSKVQDNSRRRSAHRRYGRPVNRPLNHISAAIAIAVSAAAGGVRAASPLVPTAVVHGSAAFATRGAVTTITAANRTIIDYSRFNIPAGNTVRFVQPDATATVLNRINSATPSQIDGNLLGNGIVYLANPAGVLFGPHSVVNVGQLFAAASHISNHDFLSGINHFTGSRGVVDNQGTILASAVNLIGRQVSNEGTIMAPKGMVALAAGNDVYLGRQNGNVYVELQDAPATTASQKSGVGASNTGTIDAAGGSVNLTAGDVFSIAARQSGTIKAASITVQGGAKSTVLVSGKLDADNQAPNQTGGTVNIGGGQIGIGVNQDASGNFTTPGVSIDADGASGGGKILIGVKPDSSSPTGYSDAANYDYISNNSSLSADATVKGNGGLIDTSGANLQVNPGAAITATGAGVGTGGTWLMDPTDVDIVAQVGSGSYSNVLPNSLSAASGAPTELFQPASATLFLGGTWSPAYVAASQLAADMANGTNVTIETTGGGDNLASGNINDQAPITVTYTGPATGATLTLDATNQITVEPGAPITATNGPLNVHLSAGVVGDGASAAPSPSITIGAPISTDGGVIDAQIATQTAAGGGPLSELSPIAGLLYDPTGASASLTVLAPLNTKGGGVALTTQCSPLSGNGNIAMEQSTVFIGAGITTGGGYVQVYATTNAVKNSIIGSAGGYATVAIGGSIDTDGGDITILSSGAAYSSSNSTVLASSAITEAAGASLNSTGTGAGSTSIRGDGMITVQSLAQANFNGQIGVESSVKSSISLQGGVCAGPGGLTVSTESKSPESYQTDRSLSVLELGAGGKLSSQGPLAISSEAFASAGPPGNGISQALEQLTLQLWGIRITDTVGCQSEVLLNGATSTSGGNVNIVSDSYAQNTGDPNSDSSFSIGETNIAGGIATAGGDLSIADNSGLPNGIAATNGAVTDIANFMNYSGMLVGVGGMANDLKDLATGAKTLAALAAEKASNILSATQVLLDDVKGTADVAGLLEKISVEKIGSFSLGSVALGGKAINAGTGSVEIITSSACPTVSGGTWDPAVGQILLGPPTANSGNSLPTISAGSLYVDCTSQGLAAGAGGFNGFSKDAAPAPSGIFLDGPTVSVITSGGGQVFQGPLLLRGNATLEDTGGGDISLEPSLGRRDVAGVPNMALFESPGGIFNGAAGVAPTLAVETSGAVSISDSVGLGDPQIAAYGPIGSLEVNGGGGSGGAQPASISLGGSSIMTAGGGQDYDGPIYLDAPATLTDSGGGNISFCSTVDSGGGGPQPLAVSTGGYVYFGGNVGASGPLASLSVSAPTIYIPTGVQVDLASPASPDYHGTTPTPSAPPSGKCPSSAGGGTGGRTPPVNQQFTLPAATEWDGSGISVQSGETITISASGEVYIGDVSAGMPSVSNYQTPAGDPGFSTANLGGGTFAAPGLVPWSLVGRIGANGTPFEIGNGTTITASSSGELYLSVNDNVFGDDTGSWAISIQASGAGEQNLLANANFDQGLAGWTVSTGSAIYTVQSSDLQPGTFDVQGVETNADSLGRLLQSLTGELIPGQNYDISGWIKTDNVVGPPGDGAVIGLDYTSAGDLTPADGYVAEIGHVEGTTGWTHYSDVFTLPGVPTDASGLAFLLDFNNAAGTAWFQGLSLTGPAASGVGSGSPPPFTFITPPAIQPPPTITPPPENNDTPPPAVTYFGGPLSSIDNAGSQVSSGNNGGASKSDSGSSNSMSTAGSNPVASIPSSVFPLPVRTPSSSSTATGDPFAMLLFNAKPSATPARSATSPFTTSSIVTNGSETWTAPTQTVTKTTKTTGNSGGIVSAVSNFLGSAASAIGNFFGSIF